MKKDTSIARAKKFVNDFVSDQFEEDGNWADDKEYDFRFPAAYFVIMNAENHGYYQQCGEYYTKAELDKLLLSQIRETEDKGSYSRWDNIYIFDVKKNKVVKPRFAV